MGYPTKLTLTAAIGFVLLFLGQGLVFIRVNTQTYDEAMHLAAGYSYLARQDFRLEPQNPPLLKMLAALPLYLWYELPFRPEPTLWERREEWQIGQDFLYGSSLPAEWLLTLGRLPTLLFGAALVGFCGWWAYRLWGHAAAVLAMALAALEPNLIAHSSLIKTDVGAAFFTVSTLYLLWEYTRSSSGWLLVATGLSLGLALGSKYSTILLVGMLGIILIVHLLLGGNFALPWTKRPSGRERGWQLGRAAVALCLLLSVAALVLLPLYYFQGFTPWWRGLQAYLSFANSGQPAFLFGRYAYEGWWYYFPLAFLIKTPLGSLLLMAAALLVSRVGMAGERRAALFLLGPVVVIFAAMTQSKVNLGLRHILPVYPLLFVFASRLATLHFRRSWLGLLLLGVPLVMTALSSLKVAPHQLAYFNELVGGPEEGYRYLSDSNLDWGQDLKGLKGYMEREGLEMIYLSYFGSVPPAYYGIHYQPAPAPWEWQHPVEVLPHGRREVLAISVTNLQGVSFKEHGLYRWLYSRTPIAKIGYSIFVYDLTGDADAHVQLARLYLSYGPRRLAEPELQKALAIDATNQHAQQLLASEAWRQ